MSNQNNNQGKQNQQAENVNPQNNKEQAKYEDSYVFSDTVLEKIAGIAARDINGILTLKGNFMSNITGSFMDRSNNLTQGVRVEVGDNEVVVHMKMVMEYGAQAPRVFEKLRGHVAEQIYMMTGLSLVELHIEVVDIMTRQEFEEANKKRFAGNNADGEAPVQGQEVYA